MRTVNERYGPLDWRLPEAHAIYWASIGMHRREEDEDVRRLRHGDLSEHAAFLSARRSHS